MQAIFKTILFTAIGMICISILFFWGMIISLPLPVIAVTILVALFFTGRWFFLKDNERFFDEDKNLWPILIIVPALFLIVKKTYYFAAPHGEWDGWAMWNLHARYLAMPEYWQRMFLNTDNGHPDYPLGQPGLIAFFIRLFGDNSATLVPFIVNFIATLFIPLLIFSDIARKNIVVAGAALFLFSQDVFYLFRGVSQYADTLLAFMFLCAIVCIYHGKENKKYILLSALFAAACMWIKNEGIVLFAIFMAFNYNTFLKPAHLKYLLIGILIPSITLLFFKLKYATSNDMVGGQGEHTMGYITDKSRYKTIYLSFKQYLNKSFYYTKIAAFIYLLITVLQKRFPDRQLLMLSACLVAYLGFFVVTPNNLEWHLESLDRLMHQLMPAFIYVMAQRFSDIRFTLSEQKLF